MADPDVVETVLTAMAEVAMAEIPLAIELGDWSTVLEQTTTLRCVALKRLDLAREARHG